MSTANAAQASQGAPKQNPIAANMQARQAVLRNAIPFFQSVASGSMPTPDSLPQATVQIPPQNVGLIRGFMLKITATITNPNAGSSLLTLTPLGTANLVQQFTFNDLQNYQRINTTGWHMAMLNSAKQGRPFLSSTPSDSPMGFGSNMPIIKAPATIATNTSGTIYMYYWIPLSYQSNDLTGAIWANVVNATMQLGITFAKSAQAIVSNTTDPTLAIYQGAGAVAGATITNISYQLYQDYLDQLPVDRNTGKVITPDVDLNTMYEIKNTTLNAIPANSDYYIPYSNFRHFLSTTVIFDNQTGGAYPSYGTDVNYWAFRTANMTDMRKADPFTWGAFTRRKLLTDPPVPIYYFDTRERPIFTTQTGNTDLILNASTVNANAQCMVGWEMLGNVQNLVNAASLSSAG